LIAHRPPAKFALLRMPDAVASVPLAQATLKLFASVWKRHYENVYLRGEALSNLARRTDHLQADLAEVVASLAGTFIGKHGCACTGTPNYYVPDRILPPAYIHPSVKSIHNHTTCPCTSISWSTDRPPHSRYVARARLDCIHHPQCLTIKVALSHGWHFDTPNQILKPIRIQRKTERALGICSNNALCIVNNTCPQFRPHF